MRNTGSDAKQGTPPLSVFLMGPTASGKTDLAIKLVEALPCEIISVDSALIYKQMNIGTAKPDAVILKRAPHRLIDILDPTESYSVATFRRDALAAMKEITNKGKIPLLVGGTMLYFKTLVQGIADLPKANDQIRADILQQAETQGWISLHNELSRFDSVSASRIKPTDTQRLQRAVEVYRVSGKSMTQWWQEQATSNALAGHERNRHYTKKVNSIESGNATTCFPYRVLSFATHPVDRKMLHARIEQRFHKMLEAGFVEEVRALYQRGDLSLTMPSMRCVGYRQIWEYLDGILCFDDAVERGIIATRQLAKRQITWLRRWESLSWLDPAQPETFKKILECILDEKESY